MYDLDSQIMKKEFSTNVIRSSVSELLNNNICVKKAMTSRTTMCNFKTLMELLEIPFVGTGGEQSANVADKATSRALLLQAGVKVPR